MLEGPPVAAMAALIGDPARANMLTALLDGRALTVGELAHAAGVGMPTASTHLAKLEQAGLLTGEKQGRHRYLRLADPDVGLALEALMSLAQRTGAVRVRTGPRDGALRQARVCYDHLAGGRAVGLMQGFLDRDLIRDAAAPQVTPAGVLAFEGLGIDMAELAAARRPVCRTCLDWSERRGHLGGSLGAAILDHVLRERWATRGEGRVIAFTPAGGAAFDRTFGSLGG